MAKIFLSYRRGDSQDVTGRIYDALVERFSKKCVFKDVDSIPLGKDFRRVLQQAVKGAGVVIAVIGPRWLTAADAGGRRRLDDPDDFVRLELEMALALGKPVIPITVSHAGMVAADDLPESIRPLAFQNGLPVRPDPDFHNDMTRLIGAVEQTCPGLARQRRPGGNAGKPLGLLPVVLAVTAALVLLLVVGIGLLGRTTLGGDLARWMSVARDNAAGPTRASLSPEMEIKRLKGEIARLDDDLKRSFPALAEAEVKRASLQSEVKDVRENLKRQLEKLKALEQDPAVNVAEFARLWDAYKAAEGELAAREKLLTEKTALVQTARARCDALKTEKARLEEEVVKLETNLEQGRLTQTDRPIAVDESRLADIKKELDALDTQIRGQQREPEINQAAGDPAKVGTKSSGSQALEEFRKRFGDKSTEK
jgi:hypothetical protein